ncbi:hypothetical protein CKO25_17945 [Thiocapsa imhoffii]|uniref:Peptidase M23 domain-containing protein n=1 Tax=Thiocapsa imhoffii TaxID=382777 RepID=A0A9X0WKW7_9GAMM|nr:hypothetical protein [Thiocapsa imhoffii]MBK1646493.1 hypothetical protein [Thiocapsa imhoffii]
MPLSPTAFAGAINGQVIDLFGDGIEGVEVSIPGSRFAAKTDSNGQYELDFVPGNFTMSYAKGGFTAVLIPRILYGAEDFPAETVRLVHNPAPGVYYVNRATKSLDRLSNNCNFTRAIVGKKSVSDIFRLTANPERSLSIPTGLAMFFDNSRRNDPLYGNFNSKATFHQSAAFLNKDNEMPLNIIETAVGDAAEFRSAKLSPGMYLFVDNYDLYSRYSRKPCNPFIVSAFGRGAFEISQNAVWNPVDGDPERIRELCMLGSESERHIDIECMGTEMAKAGATPEAIAFAIEIHDYDVGPRYLSSFVEAGAVDYGTVTHSVLNDPNVTHPVFLNDQDRIVTDLYRYLDHIDIAEAINYSDIISRFPKARIWPMASIQSRESMDDWGQRFIVRFIMLNGCRACEIAGHADVAFDFVPQDGKGGEHAFVAAHLVKLIPETVSPVVDPPPHAESISWQFPVTPYRPGSYGGRGFYFDKNHLGEDIRLDEGTPILAIGPGTIVHYGPAPGYGELVAAVEHDLGPNGASLLSGNGKMHQTTKFLSIYGHLRACDKRDNGICTNLSVGDPVTTTTVIGYINDHNDDPALDHNGDGKEHLHLGIRLMSAAEAWQPDAGKWLRGYESGSGTVGEFAAASKVIPQLQSLTVEPGGISEQEADELTEQ